ncbi:aluminum activated malate transporter family protein [Tasmannia lanceolata]|uniref:aluminum activated malate transporter family protein n=1 Tax=Tasmannia lanceolata TaxID=3420 RepID=UPI0040645281
MTSEKRASCGLEWRVVITGGASEELVPESGLIRRAWLGILGLILGLKLKVWKFLERTWKVGVDDPRRVIHCLKVGISLTLVTLFYYLRPLYDGVGGTAMWAVMTVVVIFEYTVGATLYKGLNRGMATLLAGCLAVGVHSLASRSGDTAEPIVLGISVFLIASAATFSRFMPTVKTCFDYGAMIFILTFSLVAISGYRVDKLIDMAHQRLSTIAIGGSMCFLVSMLVFPVWAGDDLHLFVTRNMKKLANSLDGCVAEYFNDSQSDTDEEEPCQKSQGYKCVLNSKAAEESLANFARWEPAHGRFGFRYPWKQYLKIGSAMRYCACCVEALNASINSEIKAPEFMKKYLSSACLRLSYNSSNVLRELAESTKNMRKSSSIDVLIEEMNSAIEDVQNALKSLPHQVIQPPPPPQIEAAEKEKLQFIPTRSLPLIDVMPLATIVSLLIEIASRIEGIVDEVDELAGLVDFKPAMDEKPKQNQPTIKTHSEEQGQQEDIKALQKV